MGISGLLSAMQPATRPAHIRDYAGRTLVIDGATLLYKASYVSAYEIALGLPPAAWLDASWQYIGRRIDLFRNFGITPIFVLDGRRSPLKVGCPCPPRAFHSPSYPRHQPLPNPQPHSSHIQRETDAKRSGIRQGYLREGHAARDQALHFPEGSPQREALMARARDSFQKVGVLVGCGGVGRSRIV